MHAHTRCAPILCDYYYCSDHDTDCCPHVTFMDSRIDQIEQKMKRYEDCVMNMTRWHIHQFSDLVKGLVESTLRPTLRQDLLDPRVICWAILSSLTFELRISIWHPVVWLWAKNDIFTPSFSCAYPLETNTSMDTTKDIPYYPLLPLSSSFSKTILHGDRLKTNASSNDQCGIFVVSKDILIRTVIWGALCCRVEWG